MMIRVKIKKQVYLKAKFLGPYYIPFLPKSIPSFETTYLYYTLLSF